MNYPLIIHSVYPTHLDAEFAKFIYKQVDNNYCKGKGISLVNSASLASRPTPSPFPLAHLFHFLQYHLVEFLPSIKVYMMTRPLDNYHLS